MKKVNLVIFNAAGNPLGINPERRLNQFLDELKRQSPNRALIESDVSVFNGAPQSDGDCGDGKHIGVILLRDGHYLPAKGVHPDLFAVIMGSLSFKFPDADLWLICNDGDAEGAGTNFHVRDTPHEFLDHVFREAGEPMAKSWSSAQRA